jgi:hypothetical protein
VVGCGWCAAGIEVDFHAPADADEGRGCDDVIDAPTPVVLKRISEIVTTGVLDTVGCSARNISVKPQAAVRL